MNFSIHHSSPDAQWQTYQELEQITDTASSPSDHPRFMFGLGAAWKILISLLIDELIEEQRVDYLERCWQSSQSGNEDKPDRHPLRKFLVLIS